MKTAFVLLIFIAGISACKKNDNTGNNGNNNNNNNSQPVITSTSPQYTFWGDELTINGSGFSTVKTDNIVYVKGNVICSSDSTWQKAEVVSATANKLVIKVPFTTNSGGIACGNDYARARVTVNNKSAVSEIFKLVGWPMLGSMCYHYGGFYHASTTRPGDSVVLQAGIQGLYAHESGYMDQLSLSVNGNPVNYKWRTINTICSGMGLSLDPLIYSDLNNCNVLPGSLGEPCRKMTFTLKINNTNKSHSQEYFVMNHPTIKITNVNAPQNISISAGGNPYVSVTGKNMFFTQIRWSALNLPSFTVASPTLNLADQMQLFIPLSQMQPNTSYSITGISQCGKETTIGGVSTIP